MSGRPSQLFEVADHLAGDPVARRAFEKRVYGKIVDGTVKSDTSVKEDDPVEVPEQEFFD
jgi:hypothetical protein